MYQVLNSIFSVLLAVIAFITNSCFGGVLPNRQQGTVTTKPADAITIQYGDSACENMDLFIPASASGKVNVVLMIHGGAWMNGDQTEFDEYCETLANTYSYVAVSVDYDKIQNGATSPKMVDEIAAAVSKVKDELSSRSLTAGKMAVIGHSSGAHLALMYAYTKADQSAIPVAFVLSCSAPSDFLDTTGSGATTLEKYNYLALSGLTGKVITADNAAEMADVIKTVNPIDNVTSSVPPTLIVHGAKDTMVSYTNSQRLYQKLQDCGVYTEFITYPNSDHFLKEDGDTMNSQTTARFFAFAAKYF